MDVAYVNQEGWCGCMNAPPHYVNAGNAEKAFGVERRTLIRWAEAGNIRAVRHGKNGHWRFDVSSVEQSGLITPVAPVAATGSIKAIYARVSTRKQLPDLQHQIASLATKYPDHVVFSDCASGLNFKRKGLLSILQLAFEGRLQVLRLAYRDRLCRFAYDLIEHVLTKHGAKIEVENDDTYAPERELAEDVVSIITVFGARLYGCRSGRSRKAKTGSCAKTGTPRTKCEGGGATQTEDAISASSSAGWMSADIQGEDDPNPIPDCRAEEVLRSCPLALQSDECAHKRRRTEKQDTPEE